MFFALRTICLSMEHIYITNFFRYTAHPNILKKCDYSSIINSPINENLTAIFKIINKLGWDLYD